MAPPHLIVSVMSVYSEPLCIKDARAEREGRICQQNRTKPRYDTMSSVRLGNTIHTLITII